MFSANAFKWATQLKYNCNFVELVGSLVQKKKIRIVHEAYDVFGINPLNPSSVIVWEKII